MMYYLSIELRKTKRRGLWLVLPSLLLIITVWAGRNIGDERFLDDGWLMTLFDLPLLNAILIPTFIAVLASRIIDMEHRGNTWKMLETLQNKRDIYLAKVIYGLIAIVLFAAAETAVFLGLGYKVGFKGTPDGWAYGLFFVQTFMITLNLYLLQMILSLIFSNQAVALCVGLCGSMAGLFLMYVPQFPLLWAVIPWGHYGASMFVNMDAEKNTVLGFYYAAPDAGIYFFIIGWFFLLLIGGWFLFQKMDTDGFHFHMGGHDNEDIYDTAADSRISTPHKSHKQIKIPQLPTELIKIRRTPLWLAFLVLPLIAALIGTANYLNNLELLKSTWLSLWTQHTLFFCYFFMPPLLGVYASYLWRLEHTGSNWNLIMVSTSAWRLVFDKIAVCAVITVLTLLWQGILYILCGLCAGLTGPVPARLPEWLACGALGGIAVCAIQCFLSLVIRSFAIPIGIALFGGICGLIATAKGYYYLLPYALMCRGIRANNPNLTVDMTEYVSYSLFFIILFYLLSVWYIGSHDVKTQ